MTHASITDIVAQSTAAPISAEEEGALVLAAQAGDQDAALALVAQYGPAIRNALARIPGEALDPEDAAQEAAVAFLGLVQAHDPATGRLAGRVAVYLTEALQGAASATSGWAVPARTVKRFLAIRKAADGDLVKGAAIAPEHEMASARFLLLASVLSTGTLDDVNEGGIRHEGRNRADTATGLYGDASSAFAHVEDTILVDGLLSLLDERETAIIRYAYGFDAIPGIDLDEAKSGAARSREEGIAVANDAAVARHLGLTRPTVQRTRAAALAKMREALTEADAA